MGSFITSVRQLTTKCIKYHSMARANLKKSKRSLDFFYHSIKVHTYPRGPESASIEIPLSDPNLLSKSASECEHCETKFTYLVKKQFLEILWSVVWNGGFQFWYRFLASWVCTYFDAVVVKVKTFLLLFIYSDLLWPYCGTNILT